MLLYDIRMAELKGFGFCLFCVFFPIKKRTLKKGNSVSLSTHIAVIFRFFGEVHVFQKESSNATCGK